MRFGALLTHKFVCVTTLPACYKVSQAIDIPNFNEHKTKSHLFTCHHWVSEMFIQIYENF